MLPALCLSVQIIIFRLPFKSCSLKLSRRRQGQIPKVGCFLFSKLLLIEDEIDNPLLVQGTTTKQALLDAYLADEKAVLMGTGAFWEGVDVRGNDLVCVMIDKLPFASPDDPLLQARMDDVKKRGANPFGVIQIPQAVIALKQGAGRLIRDPTDKGVLVICDNRLVTKPYAKTFIGSLPNMRRTRSLDEVESFLARIDEE